MPRMFFADEDNNDITFDEPTMNCLAVEPTLFARIQNERVLISIHQSFSVM